MKVNFKKLYLPPLFKLAEFFPYLMVEKSTSFVKPSSVNGRGEIDPKFVGSLTLPFTSHTISTLVLCTQKSGCFMSLCMWLGCVPGSPCSLQQWGGVGCRTLCLYWACCCSDILNKYVWRGTHCYLLHPPGLQLALVNHPARFWKFCSRAT